MIFKKSSLDELPGLINVIKGDMSLVGPRPLYPFYLPYYTPEKSLRPYGSGELQVWRR